MSLFNCCHDLKDFVCLCCPKEHVEDGIEVVCVDSAKLSYVGRAAYEILRTKHSQYYQKLWNVTTGKVSDLHYTPKGVFRLSKDPSKGHDDWFPSNMFDLIVKTKKWCDIMSLSAPDGMFMEKFHEALKVLVEKNRDREEADRITIRMMFGWMGSPVNCNAIIEELTKGLPQEDSPIKLWVGAWRKKFSWNHAKIIAVDGQFLFTGGHNLWDPHYLKQDPVCDLSFELEGKVTHDAHHFANDEWAFVEKNQWTLDGNKKLEFVVTRVFISEYPKGKVGAFPPQYVKQKMPALVPSVENALPMISMGRYGAILDVDRPSDDAFIQMIDSAKTIIRMAIQDLGPVCWPFIKKPEALPGMSWPIKYLKALARVIWEKGVDVEIILSNPHSKPNHLKHDSYGYGWSCSDVASEIIKQIKKQFPDAESEALRKKVNDNLRVCFIRSKQGRGYEDGMTIGLHSKHFIIDDVAAYIGSQNLYVCDLAEWGVLVDNADAVAKMKDEFWNPIWEVSFTGEDADVDEIMDGLHIDREGAHIDTADKETRRRMEEVMRSHLGRSHGKIHMHDD